MTFLRDPKVEGLRAMASLGGHKGPVASDLAFWVLHYHTNIFLGRYSKTTV